VKEWKDIPSLQVSREAPGVHGTASEANLRSSADAAGLSQKMPRIIKINAINLRESTKHQWGNFKKEIEGAKRNP